MVIIEIGEALNEGIVVVIGLVGKFDVCIEGIVLVGVEHGDCANNGAHIAFFSNGFSGFYGISLHGVEERRAWDRDGDGGEIGKTGGT